MKDSLKHKRTYLFENRRTYDSGTTNQKQRLYSIMNQLTEIVQRTQSQIANRDKKNN